jgi:hypothetical protein
MLTLDFQEFFGVDAREYEVIEEALGEPGRTFKPRCVTSMFCPFQADILIGPDCLTITKTNLSLSICLVPYMKHRSTA